MAADAPSPAPSVDEVSLQIAAAPEVLYAMVSDITKMGRLSPECTGGRWFGKLDRPVVGARFLGFNRRGWARWATLNTIVAAEPGREFAFETGGSGVRWRYRFEPVDGGTLVTESREPFRTRPLVAKVFAGALLGGAESHDDEVREGMAATLERLQVLAEG